MLWKNVSNINCLSLLFFVNLLFAQQRFNFSYVVHTGFPSDIIYDVKIDKLGRVWVITPDGPSVYDGKKIRSFSTKDGLISNDNYKILIDSKNNIWFFSHFGVSKISNKLEASAIIKKSTFYYHFMMNRKDEICFTFNRKDYNYETYLIKNDSVSILRSEWLNKLNSNKEINKYHGLTYFYNDSLYKISFDKKLNNVQYHERLELNNNSKKISKNNIDLKLNNYKLSRFFQFNRDYSILLSESDIKAFYKDKVIYYSELPENAKRITDNDVLFDNNILFIPTNIGILNFSFVGSNFSYNGLFFSKKNCTGIVKDIENTIWISSLSGGLFKVNNPLLVDCNIGSQNNLIKINGFKSKKVFAITNENTIVDLRTCRTKTLNGMTEIKFIEMDEQNILVGGNNALFKNWKNELKDISIKAVSIHNNQIAIQTFRGLVISKFPKIKYGKSDLISIYVDIPSKSNVVYLNNNAIYFDDNYNLCFVPKNNFKSSKQFINLELNTSPIRYIKGSTENRLWVATNGSGIFLIENDKLIMHFNDELLASDIHSLKVDEKDQVWVSTKNGVNKIFKQNNIYKVVSYTSFHGLPSDYVYDTYAYNDTLYVATNKGLVLMDMCKIDNEIYTMNPPIYIERARLLLGEGNHELTVDSTIYLNNDENDILFEYRGISYRSNGNINYEYRLSPSFDEWRYTSNDNITFNDLSSGEYVFEVRAINAIGTKSAQPACYSFVIKKHYTETLWFRATAFLGFFVVIGAVFYGWFAYKRRKQNEKYTFQRQINELKLKSLQAQMNPHFVFNSLNAVQQFINVENKKAANDYLSRFARLMRMYLTGSDAQFITLQEELNVIQLYCSLEHLRFSDKFTYTFSVEPNLPLDKYNVPAMLLQPHVENAIRHGLVASEKKGSHLMIEFRSMGHNGILCVIEDNGVGREASTKAKVRGPEQHRSLGNKISKERLDLIRSLNLGFLKEQIIDLRDASGAPCGTRVEVTIFSSGQLNFDRL